MFRLRCAMLVSLSLLCCWASLREAAGATETGWFPFSPEPLAPGETTAIDLRFLNEKFAGENGGIQVKDGQFVFRNTQEPVRLWAVNGPPHGLKGEDIPLFARFFCVVDVWDALSSDRPYRKRMNPKDVTEYLKKEAGKLFDPYIIDKFIPLVETA